MCGINGFVYSSRGHQTVDRDLLVSMRDVLVHRGPDDEGLYAEGPVGLGHRRLSIVDVAAGHQPMTNEDGSLQIVYNGEIYNHADIRPDLERKGHRYRTRSDTETILHLYEEEGPQAVKRLRGMFAFAIWDARKQELFLARDRLGIKPLYYTVKPDGSLFFASEIKALLAARAVPAELNIDALPDYLANHAPSGDDTLFVGIKRLPPGHTLLWRDGQAHIAPFWTLRFTDGLDGRRDEDLIDEWRERFRTSVRLRLMSDVPLGMFLSGGIDSSAIAAVMSGMVEEPIKTFSVAFAEREANELEYARLIAQTFHTDHHEIVVTPEEFFDALPELVWHEDEPLAHPSSVALYFVSRLASQHVKVVLTGEGSDELLGGYERYRKTIYNMALGGWYRGLTGRHVRQFVNDRIASLPTSSRVRQKLSRTFLSKPSSIEALYFDNFAVFPQQMLERLLAPSLRSRLRSVDPYAAMKASLATTDAKSLLNKLLSVDMKTYLHELLMKQDQMSMAASIESRVPFLDHELVEFTAALPERLKIRSWQTKYILRQSMKDILPEAILKRRKMGFPVPVGSWFRGAHRHVIDEYVLGERARGRGCFDDTFVRTLVQEHQSGIDHSERLWALVNFEIWQRRFLDGEKDSRPLLIWAS